MNCSKFFLKKLLKNKKNLLKQTLQKLFIEGTLTKIVHIEI